MIDPDAFELHTVNNWGNSNEEEQRVIVDGNLERFKRGADHWNSWADGLRQWAEDNGATPCIYFDDSEWLGNTNFRGFRFGTKVSFFRSRFVADLGGKGDVDFSDVVFHADADFVDAKFTKVSAIFKSTKFQGSTDFSNTEIDGPYLTFANATFCGDLSFESAKVKGCPSNFAGADFRGNAVFNYTEFCRSVDFRGATFKGGQMLFEGVKLHEKYAFFAGAEFSASVTRFRKICFQGVDFSRATFSRNVVFKDVGFLDSCDWRNADFREVLSFINCTFKQVPDFNFVTFKQPPHLATMRIPWSPIGNCDVPNTEAYRALKQMAKDVGDHHHELKYFAYELHSKLYLDSTSKAHKVGIFTYWALSDFGQSLMRPALGALGLFAITAVIQWAALAEALHYPCLEKGWRVECKLEKDRMNPNSAIARERLNATLLFLPTDRIEQAAVSRSLYGDGGYKPLWLKVMSMLHSLSSAACLFLFGLGVRNLFKMK